VKKLLLVGAPVAAAAGFLVLPSGSASADVCIATASFSWGGDACAAVDGGIAIGINVDGTATALPDGAFVDGSGAAATQGGVAIAMNGSAAIGVAGSSIGINNSTANALQTFAIAIHNSDVLAGAGPGGIACNGASVFAGIDCGGASAPSGP
jgi:hypothetical protein